MKHQIVMIVLVMLMNICVLSSCRELSIKSDPTIQSNIESQNKTDFEQTDTVLQNPQKEINETYEGYFEHYMSQNPIDALYLHDIDEGNKTISEITNNYTSMWIEEFQFTLDLCKNMNIEGYDLLEGYLGEWDNCEQEMWRWEQKYLFDDSISTYGTQTYYEELKQIGDNYRSKTIWLKYVCFVNETQLDSSLFSADLKSISFGVNVTNYS